MIDQPVPQLDEGALRALVPRVIAGLVRRGEDFDAAVALARANGRDTVAVFDARSRRQEPLG